ncbi:hypothetical protein LIER_35780 [Lithospermum erythrorhizon]|uniref:Uncharacterized protein n=1 Tax=Lithospermum erythrorhizon TaxID=34254 RepID=A0AAV3NW56_LITER
MGGGGEVLEVLEKILKDGDKNSKFFHVSAIIRRRKNMLMGIEEKVGEWKVGTAEVEEVVLDYFGDMFKANDNCDPDVTMDTVDRKVTEEMNSRLTKKVTSEEVKRAVFEMSADNLLAYYLC